MDGWVDSGQIGEAMGDRGEGRSVLAAGGRRSTRISRNLPEGPIGGKLDYANTARAWRASEDHGEAGIADRLHDSRFPASQ